MNTPKGPEAAKVAPKAPEKCRTSELIKRVEANTRGATARLFEARLKGFNGSAA